MLAAELDFAHALALIVALALTYIIVFAGFGTGQHEQQGPFQHPLPRRLPSPPSFLALVPSSSTG